jgi:hypothetical protein
MRWYRTANWLTDFGPEYDIPVEIYRLQQRGLADDYSSPHEGSPSFGIDKTDEDGHIRQVKIWVNHPDPAERDDPGDRRFVVLNEENDVLANTDDVNEAVKAYVDAAKGLAGQNQAVSLESIQERLYDLGKKGREARTPGEQTEFESLRKRFPKSYYARRNGWYRRAFRKTASWLKEFGQEYDVPREILDLINKGLADDHSWHNDMSPSFGKETPISEDEARQILIWVNHPDPAQREDQRMKRFSVWDSYTQDELANTDDVNEAVKAYLDAIGEKPKAQTVTLESIQERMYDLTRKPGRMTPEEDAEMRELRRRHKELHPEKRELPKFLAGRKGARK